MTAAVSAYKTLGFYFWHDDFSVLYTARTGECLFNWPYGSYCSLFPFLDKFFNYSAPLYFSFGFLLSIFAAISFYFFAKEFLDKRTSLFLALLFSTGYVGGGAFFEVYSSITTFLSLGTLFLALTLFIKSVKKGFVAKRFWQGVVMFVLSLVALHARSFTYFIPAVLAIVLFAQQTSSKMKIYLSLIILFFYLLFYFFIPLGIDFQISGEGSLRKAAQQINILDKGDFFLQNFSSFVFTDTLQEWILPNISQGHLLFVRRILGGVLFGFLLYFLFQSRRETRIFKTGFFALFWILFLYLPFGLRSDWRLESFHRYIVFAFPGALLFWGLLEKGRVWKVLTASLLVLLILQSNYIFGQHLKDSRKRAQFYVQLHQKLDHIPEGAVLFFDFAKEESARANDFFRVGLSPPESALGTEYGIDYKKIKLFTDSDNILLAKSIKNQEMDIQKFFSFYYDGQTLFDTTQLAKRTIARNTALAQDEVGKLQEMKFVQDEAIKQWSGQNEGLSFQLYNYSPVLPTKLYLKVKASIPSIPLPYTQNCFECTYEADVLKKFLRYLAASQKLKKEASIQASNAEERRFAENLTDNTLETSWIADRIAWVGGEKPILQLGFTKRTPIDGIVLHSTSQHRIPSKFKLIIDGNSENYSFDKWQGGVELLFGGKAVSELTLEIVDTDGNQVPVVDEIDIIPSGFADIDLKAVEEIRQNPAALIKTEEDRKELIGYLSTGTKACIEWDTPSYGEDSSDFILVADGTTRTYEIDLPSMGVETPLFHLGCLNYPIDVSVFSAQIVF